jgi:hypothetical protein
MGLVLAIVGLWSVKSVRTVQEELDDLEKR